MNHGTKTIALPELTANLLRDGGEVYFKEAQQYLGFLKEQSNHYAAYIASIHMTAMRFCMLVIAKSMHQASGIADMRDRLTANATSIDYATRLWQVFRAVIAGALDESGGAWYCRGRFQRL